MKASYTRGANEVEISGNITAIILKRRDGSRLKCIIDTEDYPLVAQYHWCAHTKGKCTYAVRRENSKHQIRMHQSLTGKLSVDHRDGDGLNNRRNNLREATVSQQGANTKARSTNKSGFKGVHWHAGHHKWQAMVCADYKKEHIGYFTTAEQAALAYDEAAKRLFGEFAKTNF